MPFGDWHRICCRTGRHGIQLNPDHYTTEATAQLSHAGSRAKTLAVSRWLPASTAQVRVRVASCGICSGQVGLGQVVCEYVSVATDCSTLITSVNGDGTVCQRVADVQSGFCLTLLQETKKMYHTFPQALRIISPLFVLKTIH